MTNPGDQRSRHIGTRTVTVEYKGHGPEGHLFAVKATIGGDQPYNNREDDRSFAHRDATEAYRMAAHYANGMCELFKAETDGIADERIAEVAAGIDATMKQAEAAHLAPRQADRKAADDIVWTRNQRCLDAYVQGRPNQKPKPRTRPRPLTVLTAHTLAEADEHGHIRKGDGVTETMLRHLERCGLGVIKLGGPGRRRFEVDRLELNADGMAQATEAKLAVSR